MKNKLGMVALAFLLLSCDRRDEQREALQQLSADWDQAYALVHDLIDQAEDEQNAWRENFASLTPTEEELAELDEARRRELLRLQEKCRRLGDMFDRIAEEVEGFAVRFDLQTSQLEELETQVAEGRDVPDLDDKVVHFRDWLLEAGPRFTDWRQRLKQTREQSREACRQYARLANNGAES